MDFRNYTIIDLFRNIRHLHIGLYFSNFISNENYDYMYTHWKTGTTISAVIHELTGMKYSVCLHANEIYAEKWIANWRFINAEEIIVNNTYNKHYFNLITNYKYKNRIRVIRNIPPKIDKDFTHRSAVRSPLNLLSLGRLIHFKDHPTLLNACKIMSDNGLDFKLVIGGEGDSYQLIQSLAKDLKIESNIKMIGSYNEDDLWDLFQNADLFIHASGIGPGGTRDGLPNVIIEAMMACVPVISTYISSIPEAIENEKDGLLIPEKNPEALYEAIIRLISDHHLYETISRNSPIKAQKIFNKTNTVTSLIDMINKS